MPGVGDQVQDHLQNLKGQKEVSVPLSIIFQKSWQSGEVLTDWKRGNTTLIFKKGKKEDLGNYSKIMEEILSETMLKHMENNQVIDNN